MKKLYLLSAIVLLSSVWVVAQSATGSNAQSNHKMKTTVEGCLGGSAANYVLTESSGKEFDLRGDTSKLGEHLGQEVKISGEEETMSKSSTAASSSTSTASKPTIEVSSVEKIANTCSTTRK